MDRPRPQYPGTNAVFLSGPRAERSISFINGETQRIRG